MVVRDDQTGEEVVDVVVPGGGGGGGDTGGNEWGGKKKEKQVVVAGGNDTYSEWSWVHVRLRLFLPFCPPPHPTTTQHNTPQILQLHELTPPILFFPSPSLHSRL